MTIPTPAVRRFVLTLATGLIVPLVVATSPAQPRAFRLEEATIAEVHAAFDAGVLTCRQLAGLYLDRIRTYDDGGPRLNAITTVNPRALDDAAALDTARARKGPLHCIPVLLKDNIDSAGLPTSNGSVILKDARPPDDAFIVRALRDAGALILGKAAMGEFAGGSYNTIDGQTKNPYHLKRDTGGSSSGSAAAVAANLTMLAIGTDTSTSVRGPAAFTGIVGLRPTTGLISRDGIAPKNLNFDTAGPMARSVTDLAVLLNAIAGADPGDRLSVDVYDRSPSTSRPPTVSGRRYRDFTTFLDPNALQGARLGVLRDFFGGDPEIDALANAAIAQMQQRGATLVDVKLDASFLDNYARDGSRRIRRLADYRFRKDWEAYLATLGPNVPKGVARFVELYETDVAKSALPVEASVLDLLKRSLATSEDDPAYKDLLASQLPEASRLKRAVFEINKVDALVFPYHPTFAAPISNPVEKVVDAAFVPATGRPIAATLAGYGSEGFPGIVVPMGFGSLGLPMGISFMGRPYDDGKILGYAFAYEQASRRRRSSPLMPPLPGEPIGPAR